MSTDTVSLGISRQRTLKDELSPYRIAVLVLIEDYCISSDVHIRNYSDMEELTFLSTLLQLIQVFSCVKSALLSLQMLLATMLSCIRIDILRNKKCFPSKLSCLVLR